MQHWKKQVGTINELKNTKMEYFNKVPARWTNTNFLQTYLESRNQLFCKVVAELFRAEQIKGYNAMANTDYLLTAAFLLSCLVWWNSCPGTLNWPKKPSAPPKRVQKLFCKWKNAFLVQERGQSNS